MQGSICLFPCLLNYAQLWAVLQVSEMSFSPDAMSNAYRIAPRVKRNTKLNCTNKIITLAITKYRDTKHHDLAELLYTKRTKLACQTSISTEKQTTVLRYSCIL